MARQALIARPRMRKRWTALSGFEQDLATNSVAAIGQLAFNESVTILRMLGHYVVGLTGGGTFVAGDQADIAVAIGVVSQEAFTVGTTALPPPATSSDYSWLYWAINPIQVFNATPTGGELLSFYRVNFDIRSMRKIKSGESLTMVFQYADISGTPPITLNVANTRVLTGRGS